MAANDPIKIPETWHPIPGLPGYELSDNLRVRSHRICRRLGPPPRVISLSRTRKGYLAFSVMAGGRQRTCLLHHVVALVFIGPRPPGMQVLHRDDDKSNNAPGNLYYGTPAQNTADGLTNGGIRIGDRCSWSKITEADVARILEEKRAGRRADAIAAEFGISKSMVYKIVGGLRRTRKVCDGGCL